MLSDRGHRPYPAIDMEEHDAVLTVRDMPDLPPETIAREKWRFGRVNENGAFVADPEYVSLDGGMGDNIRPALYDSRYEAVLANRMTDAPEETVTLVGKYCESGDILIRDITLPVMESVDVVAIPSTGAYALPMSSNYNVNPRPPIVMVKDGNARLIRRRETFEDLLRTEVF